MPPGLGGIRQQLYPVQQTTAVVDGRRGKTAINCCVALLWYCLVEGGGGLRGFNYSKYALQICTLKWIMCLFDLREKKHEYDCLLLVSPCWKLGFFSPLFIWNIVSISKRQLKLVHQYPSCNWVFFSFDNVINSNYTYDQDRLQDTLNRCIPPIKT